MSAEFELTGADDFARLAKALRKAGRAEIRKALTKGLRKGAKPLIPLVRSAARDRLPHGGGLNERMATAPIRVQVRTTVRDPAVAIVMKNKQPGYAEGVIKHPVHERDKAARQGARRRGEAPVPWVTQHVDGEWFDGTIVDNAHVVMPALEAALDGVVDQVVREARG